MGNLFHSFEVTVVAISLVFLILAGLMVLIQLSAKITASIIKKAEPLAEPKTKDELVSNPQYAQVAVIVALAVASEKETQRHFEVASVQRIR